MKTIEITTSQKVTIEYELGSIMDRCLAFLIDTFVVYIIIFIISLIGGLLFSVFDSDIASYIMIIFLILIYCFFNMGLEIFNNGQTLGKMALGIKVVNLKGREPSLGDYFTRWAFRLIDIHMSIGVLAIILIGSSNKGQRIGDLMGNTTVIRTRPKMKFLLNDILNINSLQDYTPQYPEVRNFTDRDMLLIKTTLERAAKYKNKAHRVAINDIVVRVQDKLSINKQSLDNVTFLRTLLKDYIVLTR